MCPLWDAINEVYLRDQKNKVYLYSTTFPDLFPQHFSSGQQIKQLWFHLIRSVFPYPQRIPNSDNTQHAPIKPRTSLIFVFLTRLPQLCHRDQLPSFIRIYHFCNSIRKKKPPISQSCGDQAEQHLIVLHRMQGSAWREQGSRNSARLSLPRGTEGSHNDIKSHLHGVISNLQHCFTYRITIPMQERAQKQNPPEENGELLPKFISQEHRSYNKASIESLTIFKPH